MKLTIFLSFTKLSDLVIFVPRGCKVHLTLYLPTSCTQEQAETPGLCEGQSEQHFPVCNSWAMLLPTASKGKRRIFQSPLCQIGLINQNIVKSLQQVPPFRDVFLGSHCKHGLMTVNGSIPHAEKMGSYFISDKYKKGGGTKTEIPPSPFIPTLLRGRNPARRDFQPHQISLTSFNVSGHSRHC